MTQAGNPPLTATLAFRLSPNRQSALLSGLLAGFSTFYAPYLSVTDNFGLYMVLGASYFLLLSKLRLLSSTQSRATTFLAFGLISGLMNLFSNSASFQLSTPRIKVSCSLSK